MLPSGIGLDVGSTTVKAVTLAGGEVCFRGYRRHRGRALDEALTLLGEARRAAGAGLGVVVTGSAGPAIADRLGVPFLHEVHAVATAARRDMPGVRTVIEIGGQDAKLLHLTEQGSVSAEMNEKCAAGTGTVIDRCAFRLGLDEGALARLPLATSLLPVVSARCGVFAEADVVGLVKAGHSVETAMLALLDAVVRQTLVTLARGKALRGPVCLLGGPNAFLPALAEAFSRHLLARWHEHAVPPTVVRVPPDAALFAALGATRAQPELERISRARGRSSRLSRVATPMMDDGPSARWLREPAPVARPSRPTPLASCGPLVIGLDAGSTTVKAVALDESDAVVASAYRASSGNVFTDASLVLTELAASVPGGHARALGITGYAAELLGPVLGADVTVVETLAHARSARRFVPDADVVCDVGGQDIKVLFLDANGVRDFRLSHQCAAGNGALLAATAEALAVPLADLADVTTRASRVPRFSLGCAVFLDTERVTAQRDGLAPADILAGMTAVLPRNVWENVVNEPRLATLGEVFVLSGGVQRNAAAVAAQADYLRRRHPDVKVVVHPFPGEAGAIGAALAARERTSGSSSRFVGLEAASRLNVTATSSDATRCRLCPSHCARTVVEARGLGEHRTLMTGNACERGASRSPEPRTSQPPPLPGSGGRTGSAGVGARSGRHGASRGLNLVRLEATRLFRRHHDVKLVTSAGRDLRIAIPRVLAQYRAAPLFTHYFEALGVRREAMLIGELTSEALWRRAAGRGTTDACFPAKVAQAHVADLLARHAREPFDVLFFPAVTHAVTAVRGCADTASCPVVAGTPLVTKVSFGASADDVLPNGVRLLAPSLVLPRKRALSQALFDAMQRVLPALTRGEHDAALEEGIAGQRAWDRRLEELGSSALGAASRDRRCAVVLIGRPYHADPGLHHELSSELASQGRTVMTLRALPHSADLVAAADCGDPHDLSDLPFLTNSGDGERLAAARCVGAHPWLAAIELSNFKCGQDTSLYAHVAEAAKGASAKPFLALHDLDETRPVASLRLRLRTFLDAVERWESRGDR